MMSDDTDLDDGNALSKISADDDLLKQLCEWEQQSRQHWGKWRDEAKSCYRYVAGDQWTSGERSYMESNEGGRRVPIVFNRIDPMVSAVLGAEILNRQEVTYLPREVGDVQPNEILNDAAQWVRDQCDAEFEESDSFLDSLICGLGWTETRMDFEEDPEGRIIVERVSPLEMWADPSTRKRGLVDRRYQWRGREMRRHDVKSKWPERYGQIITAESREDDAVVTHSNVGDEYDADEDDATQSGPKKTIWVRHHQWYDIVDGYRVINPDSGESHSLDAKDYKALVAEYLAMGVRPPQAAKIKRRKYYEAFIAGKVLLGKNEIDGFTFHCVTGKRDEMTGTWYGLIRAMVDPQKWANKWFSQILHILNTSAKGGLMYETDAFENPRKALEEWAKPDGAIAVKHGALQRNAIQERKAANYPQGLDRLMQFSFDALPQVSGVNLEMMGLVGKDQPGVLEAHRKQAGYAILAQFFDALKLYRKRQGRTLLKYIQDYISDGRLIRISGNNGNEQYVPLVRKPGTIEYDVIVDDAPMSANQKQTVWAMLVQMMPMLKDAPLPGDVWADIIRMSPLPSSLSQKIGKAISEAQSQPDPSQEAETAKTQSEVARNQSQAALNQAKAQEIQGSAPLQASKTAADLAHTEAMTAKAHADAINTNVGTIMNGSGSQQ